MKLYRKFNVVTILSFIMIFLSFNIVQAQDEPFHGGIGDGSDVAKSASTNFADVNYEGTTILNVTIDLAAGQDNETENSPFNFAVVFSEAVTDFTSDDIELSGTALPTIANVTGSGTTYNVQVSGTQSNGTVIINIPQGAATNSSGKPNSNSIITDNEVTYTGQELTVEITLSDYQNNPTNNSNVKFVIAFNDIVTDFVNSDIQLSGTANPSNLSITTIDNKTYNATITGISSNGTVVINVPANIATNAYGKQNTASINTGNTVSCDFTSPTVTINLADGQSDPTYTLPIKFKIVFSEEINYFSEENIALGGSENLTIDVTGSGRVYEANVNGAITNETVSIFIPFGITYDDALNPNEASENIKNSVTYIGTTSINDIENSILNKVYYANENLIVDLKEFPDKNSYLQIYDLKGQLILIKEITNKNSKFPILFSENIIIVRINVNEKSINRKVFINSK